MTGGQPLSQQSPSAPVTQTVQQPTSLVTQRVVQWPAQGRFSTSYQMPLSAHKIAPSVQRIIKNVDPNYFNSRLQGYATHNAQINCPKGYHLVSDASTYELMPHPRYPNPYSNFSSSKPRGSSFRFKDNSLRLKVNKFKYKALRLRLKGN